MQRFDPQRRRAPHHLHRLLKGVPHQAGTQDIVAVDHLLQRLGKSIQLRTAGKAEQRLLLIRIVLIGEVVVEQPFLQRRQRVDLLHIRRTAGDARDDAIQAGLIQRRQSQQFRGEVGAIGRHAVGRHVAVAALAHRRQGGQGRLAEQHLHIGTQAGLTHALHQLHRQQRVAAQLEKVIVPPHLRDLQQLGPQQGQGGFHALVRGLEHTRHECVLSRCWQCFAVEFAVGGQRQRRQPGVGHGQHVVGQRGLHMAAQCFDCHRLTLDKPCQQLPFATQHHRVGNLRVRGQRRFDLAQFDTHAADFHLVIVAAEVFQVAVGQPARQVAGAVHPSARVGVIDEALRRQVRPVEVTTGHAVAADVQLPRDANGHRALLRIQQVNAGIRHRRADMQRLPHLDAAGGGDHRGFGRPVVVDHGKGLRLGERAQAVAANQQGAQGRVAQALAESVFGHRRWQETHVQRLRLPPVQQRVDVLGAVMGRWQVQGGAHAQRRPDFPGHRIKAKPGDTRGMAAGVQVERLAVPVHEVADAVVLDHHALGQTSGTGGVNHIGQVRRADRNTRRLGCRLCCVAQHDHGHRQRGQAVQQLGLDQYQHRRAVVQQVMQALGGMGRVDRHVAGAGLENRQQPHQRVEAAPGEDYHPIIRLHAVGQQLMGQAIGLLVEFGVGQRLPLILRRNGLRRARDLRRDALVHGVRFNQRPHRGIPLLQPGLLGRRHQRQFTDRHRAVVQPLLQQPDQTLRQRLHLGVLEIPLVVHTMQARTALLAVAAQVDGQRQRLMSVRHFDCPGLDVAVTQVMVILFERQRHLEQLLAPTAAQTQLAVQLAQGKALVTKILLELVTYATHQLTKGQLPIELQTHRTDLGKHPDRRAKPGVGAVENRHPHHPFLTLAGAGEIHVKRRQQHMKR